MGQNESKTSWIGVAVLGGIVVALLFPPTLAAQGGLILSNGLNPTSLYRLDLLSPGVNEGRFLFDFTLSPIVHAITICPGSQVVLGYRGDSSGDHQSRLVRSSSHRGARRLPARRIRVRGISARLLAG